MSNRLNLKPRVAESLVALLRRAGVREMETQVGTVKIHVLENDALTLQLLSSTVRKGDVQLTISETDAEERFHEEAIPFFKRS